MAAALRHAPCAAKLRANKSAVAQGPAYATHWGVRRLSLFLIQFCAGDSMK